MKMRPFGRLIPWTVALDRLSRAVGPVARVEDVPVVHAVGRVAARPYRAKIGVPPFDRATWDGYALRARDTRGTSTRAVREFAIVGEVFAEGGYSGRLRARETVAIATGGPVPPGADSVVAFEEVRLGAGSIRLTEPVPRGDRIARAGEDLPTGARIVERGTWLAPVDLAALSVTGHATVAVRAKPIVAILPNGNELRSPGSPRPRGAIFESNNAALSGLVEASGGIARPSAPVPDDPARIEAAIRAAARSSDLVLVTGGSSVGERDHLPEVFPRLGKLLFHGVAVRPGKPTLAVRAGRVLVVGMPGHPTSCLSNGHWLLLPVLRKLAGLPGPAWREERVTLSGAIELPSSGMATVVPLRVRGARASPTYRGSSAIASLGGANGFLVWPPGRPIPRRGDRVLARVLAPPLGPS